MNDEFPTEWKYLCVEYDRDEQIIKRYCERIVSVNGDEATIEVGWFQMNDARKIVGDIHIERRYVKRIGGLIKTLPFTDEMKKECERQRGRSTYQFGDCAHASGTYADKCKKKKIRKYSW